MSRATAASKSSSRRKWWDERHAYRAVCGARVPSAQRMFSSVLPITIVMSGSSGAVREPKLADDQSFMIEKIFVEIPFGRRILPHSLTTHL